MWGGRSRYAGGYRVAWVGDFGGWEVEEGGRWKVKRSRSFSVLAPAHQLIRPFVHVARYVLLTAVRDTHQVNTPRSTYSWLDSEWVILRTARAFFAPLPVTHCYSPPFRCCVISRSSLFSLLCGSLARRARQWCACRIPEELGPRERGQLGSESTGLCGGVLELVHMPLRHPKPCSRTSSAALEFLGIDAGRPLLSLTRCFWCARALGSRAMVPWVRPSPGRSSPRSPFPFFCRRRRGQ